MTIVLEVHVNGERFVLAGEDSMSVLSAHVTAVGKLGPESHGARRKTTGDADIDMRVGGLTSRGGHRKDEHLQWGPRLALKPGDEVTIKVLESETFDIASDRSPADGNFHSSSAARARWMEARSLYFRHRSRFAPRAEKQDARYRRQAMKRWR